MVNLLTYIISSENYSKKNTQYKYRKSSHMQGLMNTAEEF